MLIGYKTLKTHTRSQKLQITKRL